MVLYYKVSELRKFSACKNCIAGVKKVQINGTTIAKASLFSKTFEMTNTAKCHITCEVSACYMSQAADLSRFESKKSRLTGLLPDFCK